MDLPDFRPYDVPLNLPITGPMRCQLCKNGYVKYVAQVSFDHREHPFVLFGCETCVDRWSSGPKRVVICNGMNIDESVEDWRRRMEGEV